MVRCVHNFINEVMNVHKDAIPSISGIAVRI